MNLNTRIKVAYPPRNMRTYPRKIKNIFYLYFPIFHLLLSGYKKTKH